LPMQFVRAHHHHHTPSNLPLFHALLPC
jgi:hypothetical protein